MGGFLFGLVACVLVVGLIVVGITRKGDNLMKRRVAEANKKYETHFSFGPTDAFGDNRRGVFFDPKTRKVLFYWNSEYSVQDYGYIQSWELNWTERSGHDYTKAINVFMRIKTNDLARPVIDIPMRSKEYGDVWQQRLGLILK